MSDRDKADPVGRPRGRPAVEEPGARLTTWIRVSEYEKLCRMAQRRDQSVSALVRQLIVLRIR